MEWSSQLHVPVALPPRKYYSLHRKVIGLQSPDAIEEEDFTLTGNSTPVFQPVARGYAD
jgi:hypothetical protein